MEQLSWICDDCGEFAYANYSNTKNRLTAMSRSINTISLIIAKNDRMNNGDADD